MQIRFRIVDKEEYPEGAVLDVPDGALDASKAALLERAITEVDGELRASEMLRTPTHDVGICCVWLSAPTVGALAAALEQAAIDVDAAERLFCERARKSGYRK